MKSFLQVAVPIVILMAGVAGVAFLTQNTTRKTSFADIAAPAGPAEPVAAPAADPITFADDPISLEGPPTFEVEPMSQNHRDLWFHASPQGPVQVGLWHQSCKCTNVQVGSFDLTPSEHDELVEAPTLGLLRRLVSSVKFTDLPNAKAGDYLPLPPSAGKAPRPYVLRINWDTKARKPEDGPENVRVEVAARVGTAAPAVSVKQFRFQVVPAVACWPVEVELGEITPGGHVGRDCVVWSVTRPRLDFAARLSAARRSKLDAEPCAEIGPSAELTPEELADLSKLIGSEFKVKPLCGYRFRLNLHERRGGHELELGPLHRQLVISFRTGAGERPLADLKPAVSALVRGDVGILGGDENGRVRLGSFAYDRAKSAVVRVSSTDPKTELELEPESVRDKTKVTLGKPVTANGRREWDLRIDIEPLAFLGPFDWQITLRTKGPNPRRLHVPVTGNAERR